MERHPCKASKRSNFTNSLCKGAVVVKANYSQGIGKTMVKALKISAASLLYKATLPLISSAIAPMHFNHWLSATRLGFSLKLVPEA